MLKAGATGTDMNRTSYEVIHSTGPRVMSLICSKSAVYVVV